MVSRSTMPALMNSAGKGTKQMGNSTKPFGVGAGKGQRPVTPIMSDGNKPASAGKNTTPFGPGNRSSAGNGRGSQPSGVPNQAQRGRSNMASSGSAPSVNPGSTAVRTVNRHMAGITPTMVPGVSGPAIPPAGKTKAPGMSNLAKPGTTMPNSTPRMSMPFSGPSGKK